MLVANGRVLQALHSFLHAAISTMEGSARQVPSAGGVGINGPAANVEALVALPFLESRATNFSILPQRGLPLDFKWKPSTFYRQIRFTARRGWLRTIAAFRKRLAALCVA